MKLTKSELEIMNVLEGGTPTFTSGHFKPL